MTSPSAPFPYPQGPPVISGTMITVDRYLKSPTLIQKVLTDFSTQQFVGPYLYRQSNANAGAVIYDRAASQDLFVNNDPNLQPGVLEPGSEFPNVMVNDLTSLVAQVQGYGGQFPVSYVQQRRDQRDVIGRGLVRLSNTLIQQSNNRAIQAILSDSGVAKVSAASYWDVTSNNPVPDITGAFSAVNNTDLGYRADTAIINPLDAAVLLNNPNIYNRLPREDTGHNPILNPALNGLLGLNWVESRLQPRGSVIVCQRGSIGAIAEEIPQYSRTVDEPTRERWIVMAARWDIPVITDPLSAVVIQHAITGL